MSEREPVNEADQLEDVDEADEESAIDGSETESERKVTTTFSEDEAEVWHLRLERLEEDYKTANTEKERRAIQRKIDALRSRMEQVGLLPVGSESAGVEDDSPDATPKDGAEADNSTEDVADSNGGDEHEDETVGTGRDDGTLCDDGDENGMERTENDQSQESVALPTAEGDPNKDDEDDSEPLAVESDSGKADPEKVERLDDDETDLDQNEYSKPGFEKADSDQVEQSDIGEGDSRASEQPDLDPKSEPGSGGQKLDEADPNETERPEPESSEATPERDEDPLATTPDVADLEAALSGAVDRIDDLEDLFDEYKRKNERQHELLKKDALEGLARRMLKVRSTLSRFLEYNDWDETEAEQIRAIVRQFDQQLTAKDIEEIDPEPGEEVDDLFHELAGPREQSDEIGPNRVLRVERKGFKISGYPIQPAEVIATER